MQHIRFKYEALIQNMCVILGTVAGMPFLSAVFFLALNSLPSIPYNATHQTDNHLYFQHAMFSVGFLTKLFSLYGE